MPYAFGALRREFSVPDLISPKIHSSLPHTRQTALNQAVRKSSLRFGDHRNALKGYEIAIEEEWLAACL